MLPNNYPHYLMMLINVFILIMIVKFADNLRKRDNADENCFILLCPA